MSEIKFQVGDTVQLRTGGCLMTVDEVIEHTRQPIQCVWFDDVGELKRESFAQGSLRRVTIED